MSLYICLMCQYKTNSIRQYNCHQFFHRNSLNRRFLCLYENCCREFVKFGNFRMHLYRNHQPPKPATESEFATLSIYSCNIPNCKFRSNLFKIQFSHGFLHIKDGLSVPCPHKDCENSDKTFNTISTFKSHMYRKHYSSKEKKFLVIENFQTPSNGAYGISDDVLSINGELNSCDNSDDHNDHDTCIDNPESLKQTCSDLLATMYLTLQTKHFLPESALQTLIEGFSDLNQISSQHIYTKLTNDLNIKLSKDFIEDNNFFKMLHHPSTGCFRTAYVRKNYYKQHFNFVEPVCINVDDTNNSLVKMYYIPILETIKVLMKNSFIYKQWSSNINLQNNKNVFKDITDGKVFKENIFFKENPTALRLVLFQDAFEVCNPLASSKKKHKLIGVYMVVANVAPYNRSRVDHIQLVALFYEKHIQKVGLSKFFKIIVDDILLLEKGIVINEDPLKIVRGSLIAMVGDNLGSHQIGGYIENFSKNMNFCRYCHIKKSQFDIGKVIGFRWRSKDSYNSDIESSLVSGDSSRGIKINSALNELRYYHVATPGLPPCLGHDVFEGVVDYDLMLAIKYFVDNKIITYNVLNNRLQEIRFLNENAFEAIPLIKNSKKIGGSASENLRLLQIFPLAMYDLINTSDLVWKMVLTLREICCLAMSVNISVGQIAYLKTLLDEYIDMRKQLFANVPLRPKHHYMLHYSMLTIYFGPLRHLWTLRFESKHRYFKNILRHSPNFKNVLLSLTEKHQLLQALLMTQSSTFSDKAISEDSTEFINDNYPEYLSELVNENCLFEGPKFITKHVEFRGVHYKSKMFVCYGTNEYGKFMLCRLKYILIDSFYSDITFLGLKYEVVRHVNLGVYIIENETTDLVCVPFSKVTPHEPVLQFISADGSPFFLFKSAPFVNL